MNKPVYFYPVVCISIALIMHCVAYRSFVFQCKKSEETGVRFRSIKRSTSAYKFIWFKATTIHSSVFGNGALLLLLLLLLLLFFFKL